MSRIWEQSCWHRRADLILRTARRERQRYCPYRAEMDSRITSINAFFLHLQLLLTHSSVHYEEFNKRLDGGSAVHRNRHRMLIARRNCPRLSSRSFPRSRMAGARSPSQKVPKGQSSRSKVCHCPEDGGRPETAPNIDHQPQKLRNTRTDLVHRKCARETFTPVADRWERKPHGERSLNLRHRPRDRRKHWHAQTGRFGPRHCRSAGRGRGSQGFESATNQPLFA